MNRRFGSQEEDSKFAWSLCAQGGRSCDFKELSLCVREVDEFSNAGLDRLLDPKFAAREQGRLVHEHGGEGPQGGARLVEDREPTYSGTCGWTGKASLRKNSKSCSRTRARSLGCKAPNALDALRPVHGVARKVSKQDGLGNLLEHHLQQPPRRPQ